MKKIIKRIICLGLTLVACVGGLCACNEQAVGKEYGATLINDIRQFMREDFLEENRTYGVHYVARAYDEETGTWTEDVAKITEGPRTREFIVNNEEEYLKIFNDLSSIDINFEKQMLVVHMFTTTNPNPLVLTDFKVSNSELFVTFKAKPSKIGVKNATEPGQACMAIIMDKVDITSASFERINKN